MVKAPAADVPVLTPNELSEWFARFATLDGIERARLAKDPKTIAMVRKSLGAAGDEGIWQAHRRGMSYKEIMAEMPYADDGPVGGAISRHNKRRRGGR